METDKKNNLYFAVFSFGFTSITIQILLLRELMVVFCGNELATGIMLGAWLLWISIGSFTLNWICRYAEKNRKYPDFTEALYYALLLSVSIIAPFSICFIRNIKNILGAGAGEIIGLAPMAISAFALLAPICLVFGFLFAASCRLISKFSETEKAPEEIGKIYLLESAGAAAGGLIFNFLLIRVLNPLQTALLCGALNIYAALLLVDKKRRFKRWASFSLMSLALLFLFSGAGNLDLKMRKIQWRGMNLTAVKDSIYGNIALTKTGAQLNIFENGLLLASTDDPLTAEESVHYALLEHPAPKEVLLIGGTLSGSLQEILKHPVKRIDCVELDPAVIKMAKDNYPAEFLKVFDEGKITTHFIDGRLFVKKLVAEKFKKYDVIILALPPPFTAQINRFYSIEFYRQIKILLNRGGVFSFGISSSENYISSSQAQFMASLYKSLKKEFEDVKVLPGDTSFFLASACRGTLTYDYGELIERLKERNLNLRYVNQYGLPFKFDKSRIEYLENAIYQEKTAKLNRDFNPIGYFYDMVLWANKFNSSTKEALKKMGGLNTSYLVLALFIFFAISLFLQFRKNISGNSSIIISIVAAGLSGMLLQIAIILGFQVIYGYIYYKIGAIFASFMAGLVIGSLISVMILRKKTKLLKIYLFAQLSLSAFSFALPSAFLLFNGFSTIKTPQIIIIETLFLILPAIAGFISGFLFPLANKILSDSRERDGKTAGFLYGAELIGACVGALFTSAILIPIIGINASCYLTGLLNLLVSALLLSRIFLGVFKRDNIAGLR